MNDAIRPPIPASCEARPTISGLVIPWVNVQLADGGVDFRSQHDSRAQRCFREGLCQLCSNRIDGRFVFLGGPRQLDASMFDEPPLHPECAVYTSKACPMVAGRMEEYRKGEPLSAGRRGDRCPDPDCDCGGWVPSPGSAAAPDGRPVHDWFAVYAAGYSCGVSADRPHRVHSGVVAPDQVLVVRHVSSPGVGRIWARVTSA